MRPSHRTPTPHAGTLVFAATLALLAWMTATTASAQPAAPLIYQGAIEPADTGEGDDGDAFGFFVDVGGPTLAVASFGDVDGALGTRTARLYRRSGGAWVPDGKVASNVALSLAPDGQSMVTLRPIAGDNSPLRVTLYRRRGDGTGWDAVQTVNNPAGNSNPDGFGFALAWDGSVLVVGAPLYDQQNTNQGRAYVYSVDGDGLLQYRTALQSSTPAVDAVFGVSVAVQGPLIAVSAAYEATATGQGAVYVFTRHPTLSIWTQTTKIIPPQAGTGQRLGEGFPGLAFATLPPLGGNPATPTLYVSAWAAAGFDGRVYRFTPATPNWSWQDTFVPPASLGSGVRYGLAIDALGDRLAVNSTAPGTSATRAVTLWERQSNGAFAVARVYDDGPANRLFGWTLALGTDGAAPMLVVGAHNADRYSRTAQGAVFSAVRGAGGWPTTMPDSLDTGESAADSDFGAALSISGDEAAVGAAIHHVGARRDQGMVYLLTRDAGGQWVPGARIVAPDGSAGDGFGSRVALDGDTLAVAAPGDDFGATTNLGSVYVFARTAGQWALQQKLQTCYGISNDARIGDRGLSLHGDRLLFASPPPQGACLYRRNGTTWSLEQQFGGANNSALAVLAPDGQRLVLGQSAGFGLAIWRYDAGAWDVEDEIVLDGPAYVCCDAVDFDGNRLVVNASQPTPSYVAALRVFARNGTNWLPEATLAPAQVVGGAQSEFGFDVALHGDTILVGAPGGNAPVFHRFVRGPAGWAEEGRYALPEPTAVNGFGYALALDARSVLVGAFVRNGTTLYSNPREGGVYAYAVPGDAVFSNGFEP